MAFPMNFWKTKTVFAAAGVLLAGWKTVLPAFVQPVVVVAEPAFAQPVVAVAAIAFVCVQIAATGCYPGYGCLELLFSFQACFCSQRSYFFEFQSVFPASSYCPGCPWNCWYGFQMGSGWGHRSGLDAAYSAQAGNYDRYHSGFFHAKHHRFGEQRPDVRLRVQFRQALAHRNTGDCYVRNMLLKSGCCGKHVLNVVLECNNYKHDN